MKGLTKEQNDIIKKLIVGGSTCAVIDMSEINSWLDYWNEWHSAFPMKHHIEIRDVLDIKENLAKSADTEISCKSFGMIVSDDVQQNTFVNTIMTLRLCEEISEKFKYILCLGINEDGYNADTCIRQLSDSGIELVYEKSGGLDDIATLSSSIISFQCDGLIYNGIPPKAYLEQCEYHDRYQAFCEVCDMFMWRCRDNFLAAWLPHSVIERTVERLSYGYLDRNTRPQNPMMMYDKMPIRFFPCGFSQPSSYKELYMSEYEQEFSKYNAIVRIWKSTLEECGVNESNYSDDDIYDLLRLGRTFGIDERISAYFEGGVPIDDLIA